MHPVLRTIPITLLLAAACRGETPQDSSSPVAAVAALAGAPAVVTPCATCRIIEVSMITTEQGSSFEPKTIAAHAGDVLRFKLAIGVHNVSFLPDSNPGRSVLPAVGPFLQLPGQTHDVALTFGAGTFYFQCDPHAALGMVGRVTVED